MAIVSLASLKGGVGKTSLSINLAAAFRNKGYRVLLIDGDPAAHASRFFKNPEIDEALKEASLARLFFSLRTEVRNESEIDLLAAAEQFNLNLMIEAKDNFFVLPGGAELHHFQWGPGARLYKVLFPMLIRDLESIYDMIVIDTAPDYNVVTRNSLAVSDLVMVPVDSSEMSVNSLEDLVFAASHLDKPNWGIVRTMIHTGAKRVRQLGEKRLESTFDFSGSEEGNANFMEKIKQLSVREDLPGNSKPIFLLDSFTKRTEQQNRLSFLAATAFDYRESKKLAECYSDIASEVEILLSMGEEEEGNLGIETEEETMPMEDEKQMYIG